MRSRDTSRDVTLRNVTLIVFCREPLASHTKTQLIPRLGAANGQSWPVLSSSTRWPNAARLHPGES